jgi:hypothetical protein
MMLALLGGGCRWPLAGAVGVNLDEKPGLVATRTFTFLVPDIEGSAVMAGWLGMRGRGYCGVR